MLVGLLDDDDDDVDDDDDFEVPFMFSSFSSFYFCFSYFSVCFGKFSQCTFGIVYRLFQNLQFQLNALINT